jgi:hypothetical protein
MGGFDPFGIYNSYMAQAFWQKEVLPEDVARAM